MFFINTDSTQGVSLSPTMPFNAEPLSTAEYTAMKNWITNGAPNEDGFVKFSDDPGKTEILCYEPGL